MKRISFKQLCPGIIGTSALLLALGGCQPKSDTPWETFSETSEPYKPRANSGNAWDEYLLAANLAQRATDKYANRADLREVEESDYLARIQDALNRATRATSMQCHADVKAHDPFLPRPEAVGFTAIGRGFGLQIKRAESNKSSNSAANPIIAAHRMADHLSQSDVEDALVGFWIASNAREQAANVIEKMDAATLKTIAHAILKSLSAAPEPERAIESEYKDMLAGVQFVQDAHRSEDYKLLQTAFYNQAAPAIEHLEGLRPSDRARYFEGFANEARIYCDYAIKNANQPTSERKKLSLQLNGERPWKRFSQHLFSPAVTFIDARDRHIARSRLFALTCLALAEGKSTGKAPAEFKGLSSDATTDPYSGRPFPYQRAEREFKVYSVGPDGRDDGGDTKGRGLEPDLTIEPPRQ